MIEYDRMWLNSAWLSPICPSHLNASEFECIRIWMYQIFQILDFSDFSDFSVSDFSVYQHTVFNVFFLQYSFSEGILQWHSPKVPSISVFFFDCLRHEPSFYMRPAHISWHICSYLTCIRFFSMLSMLSMLCMLSML